MPSEAKIAGSLEPTWLLAGSLAAIAQRHGDGTTDRDGQIGQQASQMAGRQATGEMLVAFQDNLVFNDGHGFVLRSWRRGTTVDVVF